MKRFLENEQHSEQDTNLGKIVDQEINQSLLLQARVQAQGTTPIDYEKAYSPQQQRRVDTDGMKEPQCTESGIAALETMEENIITVRRWDK